MYVLFSVFSELPYVIQLQLLVTDTQYSEDIVVQDPVHLSVQKQAQVVRNIELKITVSLPWWTGVQLNDIFCTRSITFRHDKQLQNLCLALKACIAGMFSIFNILLKSCQL